MTENLKMHVNNLISQINHDHQDIKYSVYRVAMKLCQLQNHFNLNQLCGSQVIKAFTNYLTARHQTPVDFVSEETVPFPQLFKIIDGIFNLYGIVSHSCKALTCLIYETFKDVRENTVGILPALLFFIVMGKDDVKLKYSHLFDVYSGPMQVLSKSRLSLCLTHFVRITDIVGESGNFSKIKPAVESCFQGVLGSSISEDQYLHWLLMEPQSIVWLPTMHRLEASKSSVHNVRCATCKVRPIIGLRFQCLRCIDYDSCQVCFLTRKSVTRAHRLNHPRQEYCLPAGSREKVNALARTVRNMVTKRYKRKPLTSSYLPIQQTGSGNDDMDDPTDFNTVTQLARQEKHDLENLVDKLKEENEKMSGTVGLLESSKQEAVKLDEERELLRGELDTVNMHNQSLKAELENLKCVVFSDRFLPGGGNSSDLDPGESSSSSSNAPETSYQLNTSQRSSLSSHSATSERSTKHVDQKTAADELESSLREIVGNLTRSLDYEPVDRTGKEDLMIIAAEKVRDNLCELIDVSLCSS